MITDGHVKIIIHCTADGEWLRVTVDSILRHTDYPSMEILVSASGDQLPDLSSLDRPADVPVTVLCAEQPLGAGLGRNVAVQRGDATYYVFLDPHCLVEQRDWLRRATETLERYPNASMIQPEIVAFAHPNELSRDDQVVASELRQLHYEYGAKWAWPYANSRWLADSLLVKHEPEPFEMMAGGGAVVMTRAEMFHNLGKFDSEVDGRFQETMDYCVRAWMLEHPTMVDPSIRIFHRENPKPAGQPQAMLPLIHGRLRTAYKYLSPRRRDLAEILFRQHGFDNEVDLALGMVRRGEWLSERVEHLRQRVHDDDWLFSKFGVYEEHFSGQPGPARDNHTTAPGNR